jgi:hypothetical protein
MRRFRAFWTPLRVLDAVLVFVVIFVTVWSLHPQLLVSSSLITGGDTGSHLALPAYLRTTGNLFDFTPWYPGWFAGIPAYTYYFVLPDILATFGSYIIGFAVAMKLATILGSVLMPVTAYAMGRLFRAPRPIPVALALATLPFLFDATFTIDGGNLFSTMAGEYAFSLSLALALLTIGLFARGVRTGRGYWLAAMALSATLASHVLPWIFSLAAIAALVMFELLHRRGVGDAQPRRAFRTHVVRANPFAVGVGLLALAFLPFFLTTAFSINHDSFLAATSGKDVVIVFVLLLLLSIGRIAQSVRTDRGYWLAVLDVLATVTTHFVAVRFSYAALAALVAFELFQSRGSEDSTRTEHTRGDFARPLRFAIGAGLLSLGLSAWWLLPFATTQSLSDSLGYSNVPVSTLRSIFSTLGWYNATGGAAGDRWVIVLCGVAIVVAFIVRDRLGMVLATLSVLSFWAFVLDPQSAIWNQRLIPFWFITIHLSAGWLVGYLGWRWASRIPARLRWAPFFIEGNNIGHVNEATGESVDATLLERPALPLEEAANSPWRTNRIVRATSVVALLAILSTVPGLITPIATDLHLATGGNQVTNWAETNYEGYQGQASWPEYHGLMNTMANVAKRYGCGRAMWEYNSSEQRFGTPEALMLLPYWTNNCVDSMEGLLMESSPTTPYHYLDQAELSVSPSDPQVGLDYGPLNIDKGVRHLQMLGVKYFMAFSPAVISEATADPQLQLVATTKKWPAPGVQWRIYLIKNSPMVEPLTHTPNVVANISSQAEWLAANQTWWLDSNLQKVYGAMTGPASWPRATSITTMTSSAPLAKVTVSHVNVGLQSLSFHVSRVGVPMLVKISYYPRWHVTGATGPYRVSPNLMVVVPTSKNVSLNYTSTPALSLGNVLSDITTVAGFLTLWVVLRRRRKLHR